MSEGDNNFYLAVLHLACPCQGECGYHQERCQSVPKAGRRRCKMCEGS